MKGVRAGVLLGSLLAGCEREPEIPPVPSVAMAEASGHPVETLEHGRAVYMSECARCHVPLMPDRLGGEDWHVVVPGMAWNAGISEADEEAVLAYVMASRSMSGGRR